MSIFGRRGNLADELTRDRELRVSEEATAAWNLLREEIRLQRQSIDDFKRIVDKQSDRSMTYQAIDLSTLPVSGIYFTIDPGYYVEGIYLENTSSVTCTLSVWLGVTTNGPSFFDVNNGYFKSLPVNPKQRIKAVTIKLTSGSGGSGGNIARLLLNSDTMGPAQGAI